MENIFIGDGRYVLGEFSFATRNGECNRHIRFGSPWLRTADELIEPSEKGDIGNFIRSLCHFCGQQDKIAEFNGVFEGAEGSKVYDIARVH